MPPKKVEEPEKKPLIGRVGTNLKVGIVGVPNVGKSTFFNVLTKSQAAAENFPFCTIDPNENKNMFMMIELENYKKNLELADEFGIHDLNIHKSMIYRGDVDIIQKNEIKEQDNTKKPLAAAIVGINNTAVPFPKDTNFYNPFASIDSLELYLSTKPACYLVMAKPGAGTFSLGEEMSKKYKCIHLCPPNVIADEIEQKSPTGKCIDFNMRHGKAITYEILTKMLKIKLASPAVQHRGYIVSGFPISTTTRNTSYLIKSLYGEEALEVVDGLLFDVIANLKKKKAKKPRSPTSSSQTSLASYGEILGEEVEEVETEQEPEDIEEEEEELKVELPKYLLNTCSDVIHPIKPYYTTRKAAALEQLNYLFNINLKLDKLILLSCPDEALVTKKSRRYINYKKNIEVSEPLLTKPTSDTRWPVRYETVAYMDPIRHITFDPKYCCIQPINFYQSSVQQMCNYRHDVYPFVESKMQDFDPKSVLKLDARLTVGELIYHISQLLLLTSTVNPVVIPEPVLMEELSNDMEEFWKSVCELSIIKVGSVTFKRTASPWLERCPVELKKRLSVRGNPRLAVGFLKYIYLFASLDNMIAFCRNPRPYLKLKYLEPTCRIIVTGTKSSGKTMMSECLSWLFDTPIINYQDFLRSEAQKKYDTYAGTILSEIIATIEDTRLENWQSVEMTRLTKLDEWCKLTIKSLRKYISLLNEYNKLSAPTQQVEAVEEEQETEKTPTPKFLDDFNSARNLLSFLPILDDIDACEQALTVQEIAQYAPAELTVQMAKPALPTLNDEDVKDGIAAYIIANELQNEIEPNIEESMNALTNLIAAIDAKCQKDTNFECMYGKYIIDGFPSDPENWGVLADSGLLPDYTIALIENREIDEELIETYKNISKVTKRHQDRYVLADDPLINIKLKYKKPKSATKASDAKMIIQDVVDDTSSDRQETEVDPDPETGPWASFAGDIEKFKEDWDSIKVRLEDYYKCSIEVELENKSDVQVVEEALLKLRKGYYLICEPGGDDDIIEQDDEADEDTPKDIMTYNNPNYFGEIGSYCPISYYDHGVLWEGNPEFSLKYNNKLYYFCKEECAELFQKDVSKYQSYNKPFKALPPLRICVIGCIGSGKTSISKLLAKELGLMHIDFADVINDFILPKQFKKVGRRYENPFTDIPIDDEAVTEFQMDEGNENLVSDILSNETELRKMLYNYFERGAPVLSQLMQKVITKLWFEDPFVNTGFVIDGYPRLQADVEDMTSCFCVPDLVIEIEGSSEGPTQRLSSTMFKTWKIQLSEAKENARKKLTTEKKEWIDFLTKNIVVKLICDEILDNMFRSSGDTKVFSNDSVLLDAHPSGSIIDINLFNAYNNMIQEFPEPVDQNIWEKPDEVRERIEERIASIYESDDENIQALNDLLTEHRIKIVSVNGNKSLAKVKRLALSKVSNLRHRGQSFFEKTTIVSLPVAETLLLQGFTFFSKFYRKCPVYLFENPNAIQGIYNVSKRKGIVFPIVHRAYIYFICGKESVPKFRTNPLKYITCDNISKYMYYPLRVSVIGAPKSGKSSLSEKIANYYGLICLSRGIAVRNMLEHRSWTSLAKTMETALMSGECINTDHIMKSVQTMVVDSRTRTNGLVFDGFPETAPEAMELVNYGLYPNIVFDISASIVKVGDNSQNEVYYDILKWYPPYSRSYIENRYRKFQNKSYNVRKWINNDYQNLRAVDGSKSRWQCFHDALEYIINTRPAVHYFLHNVKTAAVPVAVMCISNDAFEKRMSNFKNLCPLCLRKNEIRHNEYPVDKKGVILYKNKFYWICSEHLNTVLKNPYTHLVSQKLELPEIPALVKTVNRTVLYESGICIVTYAEHLPAQLIVEGIVKYAASYKGNTYLFCSKICRDKFLIKPHLFYDISICKETKTFPSLTLKGLPNIGYLEQTVGNLITEACCSVNVIRPKYPGLSFQLSGLLHIALYLKTHNPLIDKARLALYVEATKKFNGKCKLLARISVFLRSMDNPFAKYPVCCPKPEYSSEPRKLASRVPVPDERYDYLVEYHKPASKVPAFLNVVDIAGLVRGAAEGQGLGNAFLSHIKACDAIFNLCRAFDDEDVIHVDGDVNPVRDLETIGEELRLKDEEQLMANFEKLDRVVSRGGDKKLKPEYDALTRIKAILVDEKKHIRFGDWSAADIEVLNKYLFLTSKPALYLVNLSEKDYIRKKNKWLPKLKEWIDKNDPGAPLIPFSGVLEAKLMEMDAEERKAYLKEHNVTSALEKIIVQGYKALNLEYFFTAGVDEVKAWTIQKGTKAPQAAGRIHTDFEKGFIMAEVMHFKDFKEEGTEAACKAAGKYRQQGRNYVVEDGDIIFFKFNAGAGLKDAKKK